MKPVIVGESPSRSGDRFYMFPLSGPPALKLVTWGRLEREPGHFRNSKYEAPYWTLSRYFETRNLMERFSGTWSIPEARRLADEMKSELKGRTVILLGAQVSYAFDFHKEYWEWGTPKWYGITTNVVTVPHPSGLNRVYNDPEARDKTGDTMIEARSMV